VKNVTCGRVEFLKLPNALQVSCYAHKNHQNVTL
jgi:hypothetical protein